MTMIRIYEPRNEPEVAILRSILTAYQIPHFVHNDHFGSLQVGPVIPLVNGKAIYVARDRVEEASALVADYVASTGGMEYHPTIADKFRLVIEMVLFDWIVLGSLRRNHGESDGGGGAC